MIVTYTISRADLKAKEYKKATPTTYGTPPKKRQVELLAALLRKIKI